MKNTNTINHSEDAMSTATREQDEVRCAEIKALREQVAQLTHELHWYKKQLFGEKSEKRIIVNPHQFLLLGEAAKPTPPEGETVTIREYERGKAPKVRSENDVNDSGLRFTDDVPVERIEQWPPELQGPDADHYEIIGSKSTYRLAQRQSSFVIIEYVRPIIKPKGAQQPLPAPAPDNVLDRSIADVSFLVGLLVDKFLYHLPLYRQHQRLQNAGITLSRTTLTNLVRRAIELLRPIVQAQLNNVLLSRVLAMDETPIKAGKAGKGKLKQGWFWPLYGDADEVVFTYSQSRGRQHIEQVIRQQFSGTLLSDGYAAYASYASKNPNITHAQCWVHSRRGFIEAENDEPEAVNQALAAMAALYRIEGEIADKELSDERKRDYRLEHSKPIVDAFFTWCHEQLQRTNLLPSSPYTKALHYVISREHSLRVFLEDPEVPMDTNHVERVLRPIPMGRKNWLFCWSEIGAEHVGIVQSLICTCKLHGVDPSTYLTDVLLRVSQHPASQVSELTPRLWKEHFADKPMRSDLYRGQ